MPRVNAFVCSLHTHVWRFTHTLCTTVCLCGCEGGGEGGSEGGCEFSASAWV